MIVLRCVCYDQHGRFSPAALHLLSGRAALGAAATIVTPGIRRSLDGLLSVFPPCPWICRRNWGCFTGWNAYHPRLYHFPEPQPNQSRWSRPALLLGPVRMLFNNWACFLERSDSAPGTCLDESKCLDELKSGSEGKPRHSDFNISGSKHNPRPKDKS